MLRAGSHRIYLARSFGRNVDASGFFENQLDAGTWMTFDQSISGIRVQSIVTNFNGTWMHGSYIKVNGTVVASDHTLSPDGTDNRYDSLGRGVTTSAPKDPSANDYGVGFRMLRGHTVVVLNPANGSMRAGWPKTYDTYGDPNLCTTMATDLLAVTAGDVVAIGTFDATSCNQNLRDALTYLFGDTDYTNIWNQVRISHMFLGKRNNYGLWLSTYTGYFNADSTWFNSHSGSLTSAVSGDLVSFGTNDTISRQLIGYFKPPVTSSYTFYSNVDDACYFWIGNNAVSSYDGTNYDIRELEGEGPQTSAAIALTGGQYYPIRIQYGNRVAGGEYTFSWSNSVTAKTSDFRGLLSYDPAVPGFTPTIPASLTFNGSTDYKEITGTTSDWALGTTWTIEWWSKATSASTGGGTIYTVMSQYDNLGGIGIDIYYQNNKLVINNGTIVADEPASGVWTHVALVNNAGTTQLYYNGTSVYTGGNWNLGLSTATLVLGRRGQIPYQYFPGKLTGIRITNTAVYTGSFDPYTVALQPAKITGTKLLMNPETFNPLDDQSNSNHGFGTGSVGNSTDYPAAPITHTALQSAENNGSNGVHLDTGTYDAWVGSVPVGATIVADGIGTVTVTFIYTPTTPGNPGSNWFFGVTPGTFNFSSGTTFTFTWTA